MHAHCMQYSTSKLVLLIVVVALGAKACSETPPPLVKAAFPPNTLLLMLNRSVAVSTARAPPTPLVAVFASSSTCSIVDSTTLSACHIGEMDNISAHKHALPSLRHAPS
jgi:hypothetical protein